MHRRMNELDVRQSGLSRTKRSSPRAQLCTSDPSLFDRGIGALRDSGSELDAYVAEVLVLTRAFSEVIPSRSPSPGAVWSTVQSDFCGPGQGFRSPDVFERYLSVFGDALRAFSSNMSNAYARGFSGMLTAAMGSHVDGGFLFRPDAIPAEAREAAARGGGFWDADTYQEALDTRPDAPDWLRDGLRDGLSGGANSRGGKTSFTFSLSVQESIPPASRERSMRDRSSNRRSRSRGIDWDRADREVERAPRGDFNRGGETGRTA